MVRDDRQKSHVNTYKMSHIYENTYDLGTPCLTPLKKHENFTKISKENVFQHTPSIYLSYAKKNIPAMQTYWEHKNTQNSVIKISGP